MPLSSSQKPSANSKITSGMSNHDAPTSLSKRGPTMKAKAQITHQADATMPYAANGLGTYRDLSNNQLHSAEASPQKGRPK